jgi:hypothetical protein
MNVLAGAAFVLAELERARDAEVLIRRYATPLRAVGLAHVGFSSLVSLAATRLGLQEELAEGFESTLDSRWRDANLAILTGRLVQGADTLDEMGATAIAAFVRLAAGEALLAEGHRAEADEQLGRAGEFFRRLGATRYIQRTEALLSATA